MNVKIKKLHPDAVIPTYATIGSACFDLCATHDGVINRFELVSVGTGLAFEVPHGHVMNVFIRSGLAFKSRIRLCNAVGKIDADFRGEVMIGLVSDNDLPFHFKAGDRIAQAEIVPVKQVEFEEIDELTPTDRGAGGFGSTGR